MTATIPTTWCLTSFGGDVVQGHLRIDDEDLPRLELRWEQPTKEVDLDHSVELFLETIAKEAKKKKQTFTIVRDPTPASRIKRSKEKVVTFGWSGERDAAIGQGCGVVWKCGECGRVVVAHLMAPGTEKRATLARLGAEIFGSLDCHGRGGWQTWSLFGLRVEIPEEFVLGRTKLLTGRLDLEWVRLQRSGPGGMVKNDEALTLTRVALADVLLARDTLGEWAQHNMARPGKKWLFGNFEEDSIRQHSAVRALGVLRDLGQRMRAAILDFVLRRHSPRAEMRVWHCAESNKIFTLLTDLTAANSHVAADVLDSLECHV